MSKHSGTLLLNGVVMLVGLSTPIDTLWAASARVRTPPETMLTLERSARHHNTRPAFDDLNHLVQNSLYQHLLENEKFLKLQDMARYFWEQQTGEQRLTSNSQRRSYKNLPRRLHQTRP